MIFSKSEHKETQQNSPITKKYIFFDNASVAPVSLPAMKTIHAVAKDICDFGLVKLQVWYMKAYKAREDAAALINAFPDEIAFIKNTSHGLFLVPCGINWQQGGEIIIADQEFSSNGYPWLNLKKQGVNNPVRNCNGIKIVTERSSKGRLLLEHFANTVTPRTKLISGSHFFHYRQYSEGQSISISSC